MPYRPTIVVRNAAQCLDCGDIIESRHRHDFVGCSCGNVFVDGGFDYVRMGWHNDNWIDMSVTYEGPETLWPWEENNEQD